MSATCTSATLIQEATVLDIVTSLGRGQYPNEQSITTGIVLRLLAELGWPAYDTQVVWPEFKTRSGGRADIALCDPPGKPKVLIEVKRHGTVEGPGNDEAVHQSLRYAFEEGVPFVVLTDGQSWNFYLPAEQGSYQDRCVFKLDLCRHPAADCVSRFHRYLDQRRVTSGQALEDARAEYRSRARRQEAAQSIPSAWWKLVNEKDETLIGLITEAVESKVGIKPAEEDVWRFMKSLHRMGQPPQRTNPQPKPQHMPKPTANPQPTQQDKKKLGHTNLTFRGERYSFGTMMDATKFVFEKLAAADPSFLERCARDPAFQGKKRRYVARSVEEMYPGRPDLHEWHHVLPGGWLLITNANNQLKEQLIKSACAVAGLHFGEDVSFSFPNW